MSLLQEGRVVQWLSAGTGLTAAQELPVHDSLARNMSDEELLRRCTEQRDRGAFEIVFARHNKGFFGYLLRLTADRAIAEDVSQHCWLKLLESFAGTAIYTPSKSAKFSTFLYAIGRNYYIDHFLRRHEVAKRSSLDAVQEAIAAPTADCPESSAIDRQLASRALSALAQLPFAQRDVLSLWAAGLDTATIATVTRAPRNTVLSRKRYGIAHLRKAFFRSGSRCDDACTKPVPMVLLRSHESSEQSVARPAPASGVPSREKTGST